jgi:hypothetical protein
MIVQPGLILRGACIFALIACVLFAPAWSSAADPLGRLFLTPDQRARLEARRQSKVVEVSAAQTESSEDEVPVASYLTVQGEVVRSNGKKTIFINGVAYSSPDSPKGIELSPGRRAGEVVIVPSDAAPPVQLKVGQSLDKNSLTVDDALQRAGSITIGNKPVAAKSKRPAPAQ